MAFPSEDVHFVLEAVGAQGICEVAAARSPRITRRTMRSNKVLPVLVKVLGGKELRAYLSQKEFEKSVEGWESRCG